MGGLHQQRNLPGLCMGSKRPTRDRVREVRRELYEMMETIMDAEEVTR